MFQFLQFYQAMSHHIAQLWTRIMSELAEMCLLLGINPIRRFGGAARGFFVNFGQPRDDFWASSCDINSNFRTILSRVCQTRILHIFFKIYQFKFLILIQTAIEFSSVGVHFTRSTVRQFNIIRFLGSKNMRFWQHKYLTTSVWLTESD